MVIVDSPRLIVGGVDTHPDMNVAAVVDMNGGLLGVESFPTGDGHRLLASWMAGFGAIERVGIEGTGAYGAGLSRHFARVGVVVIEVDRPNRQKRRQRGKRDRIDAVEASRGALSGRCEGIAKSGDGAAEALRALPGLSQLAFGTQCALSSWGFTVERVTGIEPAWPAWKAGTLPLSYTRVPVQASGVYHHPLCPLNVSPSSTTQIVRWWGS